MPVHEPICPRCGYDQTGIIDSWVGSCPIGGCCTECGLGFEWADVMDPSRVDLPWYVEHGRSQRGMAGRTVPTLWFLLIPNRYWGRVHIACRIELRRLAIWIVCLGVVTHLISSAAILGGIAALANTSNRFWIAQLPKVGAAQVPVYKAQIVDFSDFSYWAHAAGIVLEIPFFQRGMYSVEYSGGALEFGYFLFGAVLLWGVILGVVPTTRRIAQIRYAHVVRAMLLSALAPVLIFGVGRMLDAVELFGMAYPSMRMLRAMTNIRPLIFLIGIVLSLIWVTWLWVAAIRIGWTIRPSWVLIVLGFIASTLGGVALVSYISLYL